MSNQLAQLDWNFLPKYNNKKNHTTFIRSRAARILCISSTIYQFKTATTTTIVINIQLIRFDHDFFWQIQLQQQ